MTTPSKLSVTFTGADNRTLIDDLTQVIDAARKLEVPIEFGLLCSTSRAGEERYPTGHAARHILRICRSEDVPVAVHLCGAAAHATLSEQCFERDAFGTPEWRDVLVDVASSGRVQVNLPPGTASAADLYEAQSRLAVMVSTTTGVPIRHVKIIGQHRAGPWPMPLHVHAEHKHAVSWLLDRSGGRGVSVSADEIPLLPDFPVGIAGGLGPNCMTGDVAAYLLRSTHGGWLDMESQIRTGGKLDPAKCVDVLNRVALARDLA